MTVTFFGHRNISASGIDNELFALLEYLIKYKGANLFLVGNEGTFDAIVRKVLGRLSVEYPHIGYSVVLAYMPSEKMDDFEYYGDTVFPEVLENVHPRFALERRNRWMVEQADIVVAYVKNTHGGAYKFSSLAKRKNKTVINIAERI